MSDEKHVPVQDKEWEQLLDTQFDEQFEEAIHHTPEGFSALGKVCTTLNEVPPMKAIDSYRSLEDYRTQPVGVSYAVVALDVLFVATLDGWTMIEMKEQEDRESFTIKKIVHIVQDHEPIPSVAEFEDGQVILCGDRAYRFDTSKFEWQYVKGSEELLKSKEDPIDYVVLGKIPTPPVWEGTPPPGDKYVLGSQMKNTLARLKIVDKTPDPISLTVVGCVCSKEELPFIVDFDKGDTFTYSGHDNIYGFVKTTQDATEWTVISTTPTNDPEPCLIEDLTPLIIFKGYVKSPNDLPDPKDFEEGSFISYKQDGLLGYIITKDYPNAWVPVQDNPSTRETFKHLPSVDPEELQIFTHRDKPNKNAKSPPIIGGDKDAGELARERLFEIQYRKIWKLRIYLVLIIIGIIAFGKWAGEYGYDWLLGQVETGRYNDERVCKTEYKGYVITGKRTFSYPYKTLFGYRLVDEEKVLETTVVDVRGDRMTIMGLNGTSWWEAKVGPGEKGIQMLKDASVYVFMTEKGNFPVSAKGFCAPPRNQPEEPTTEIKPMQ